MKTKIAILTALLTLTMTACFNFDAGDKATLTLHLSSSSNSRAPLANWPPTDDAELGTLSYEIKFSGSLGEKTESASGSGTITLAVTPGYWNIEVTAYSDGELYAYGSVSATLKTGLNNVSINMRRIDKYEIIINIASSYTSYPILRGESYRFSANTIYGALVNSADKIHNTYKWSVSDNSSSSTNIDESSGYLTIDLYETASTLTIKAESAVKPSIYGTVTITITPFVSGQVRIIEEGHAGTDIGKIYINTVLKVDTSAVTDAVGNPTDYKWWIDYNEDGIFDEVDGYGYDYELVSRDQTYTVSDDEIGKPITIEIIYENGTLTATTNSTVKDIFGIYNLDQLKGISDRPYVNYILMADNLYLNDDPLCSVDTYSNIIIPFEGTFDGNGKTINLNITQTLKTTLPDNAYAGLFAIISEDGVVKNLKLTGSVIVSEFANMYAGAVAGENQGNIYNVSSSVTVNATADYPGGLAPSSSSYAGGIAGLQAAPLSYTGSIKNCYVTGDITSTSESDISYAGGIAGRIYSNGNDNIITHCWASGTITGINTASSAYTAGIVGVAATDSTITNCVALNSNLDNSVSVSSFANRIVSVAGYVDLNNNYASVSMFLRGGSFSWSGTYMNSDGGDVTSTEASTPTWWKNTTAGSGPGWDIKDTKATANETNPWYWGTDDRPRLWFE